MLDCQINCVSSDDRNVNNKEKYRRLYWNEVGSMDPFPDRRVIMDDSLESVTVVDVYDQAAGIGKEFEKLIENYGVDAVTDLMPKVIKALEQLESLAGRYEKESSEISELRYTIDKLETEKQERSQERLRYEEVCFCKYMNS